MLKFIWKSVKWLLFGWALLVLFLPIALILWGLQDEPLVLVGQTMNYDHVSRLNHLMKAHDPRRMRAGEVKRLVTVEDDLNLALQYAASNLQEAGARVTIEKNKATLKLSIGLKPIRLNRYLNATGSLIEKDQSFWLEDVSIGQIRVPNVVSRHLSQWTHRLMLNGQQYRDTISAINELRFSPQQLEMVYQWRPELIKEIVIAHREIFSSPQDDVRFALYEKQIAQISRELSLISPAQEMLSRLFQTAYERSADNQQAAAENSAILSALGSYMVSSRMQKLLGFPDKHPRERATRRYLTLAGRYDLAQHFILSAYLSNSAGDGVADGLGLFKEFKDSQGGTGFSFADLAADQAGRKFAELATNPDSARRLQEIVRSVSSESDFMPSIENLPEGIQELEFKARYGSLESEEYSLIQQEIDRRLKTCRVYRG